MDSITRKEKLSELRNQNGNVAMTGIPLRYRGSTRIENVYKIPLDYLIYNKYNGRIGTEVLSYEKENASLDPEKEQDIKLIEGFLYNSKKDRNEKTMKSLQHHGQQRYGIVTADGKIVDGNRRAMLLNMLYHRHNELGYTYTQVEQCRFFLAIILPDDASKQDIQQLETIYQMGEDDKLDYNPIEKYLKCKALSEFFRVEDIAEFMSEKPSQIKEWLSILKLMDEYLDTYEYEGIYTRLEKTEGPFVDLNSYIDSYQKRSPNTRGSWAYTDLDISDLKMVCFDYIRARYEGKEFREIAKTGKDGSIFFYQDLWKAFLRDHQDNIPTDTDTVDELRQKYPEEDLSILLRRRDKEWAEAAKGHLEGGLRRYTSKLEDKRSANMPSELIERALNALQAVDCGQESFHNNHRIMEMIKDINRISWDMKKILEKDRDTHVNSKN